MSGDEVGKHLNVNRSAVEEIIKRVLSVENDTQWNETLLLLRNTANPQVLEAAKQLAQSPVPNEIIIGLSILGELGSLKGEIAENAKTLLLDYPRSTGDSDLLCALIHAVATTNDENLFTVLKELSKHPNREVRQGVAYSVSYALNKPLTSVPVQILISLARDPNDSVRDEAVANIADVEAVPDSIIVRDTLMTATTDKHPSIRGHALFGLARRRDERAFRAVQRELITSKDISYGTIEAAKILSDNRLHSELLKLKPWWKIDSDLLDEAIKSCS